MAYSDANFNCELKKGWKVKKDNKLRGAYGETNYDKKVIRINKKKHSKDSDTKRISPNKDGSESLLTTIYHEVLHVKHPKMHEKTVRKLEKKARKLSPKAKKHLYSLV